METEHIWKCKDTPGHFVCICGAIGVWNRDLQKIEVAYPMPLPIANKRHAIYNSRNKNITIK